MRNPKTYGYGTEIVLVCHMQNRESKCSFLNIAKIVFASRIDRFLHRTFECVFKPGNFQNACKHYSSLQEKKSISERR